MERVVIAQNSEQCIYLIKDTNLDFYLIIPNNRQVSIVLGLFPNITENIVKTLPKDSDKVIVIPVINNQLLTSANHLDTVSFKYLDSVLSYLINTSYKILTHNKLKVNSKILLNNHSSYNNFNQKFIEKYKERVELYNLVSKPTVSSIPTESIFEPVSETTIIPTFKPTEPLFKNNQSTNKLDDSIKDSVTPILNNEEAVNKPEINDTHEPGFVSYILLGVLAAVVALVILYMVL